MNEEDNIKTGLIENEQETPVTELPNPEPQTGDNDGNDKELYTPTYKPGEVIRRPIIDEMKADYIDYSMSVIVARALPEVKDGLKPSQRRIIVAMNDAGLTASAHFRKCAKIVGDTVGNYHPHGDIVVYPTLVSLAQDFAIRYTLVDGQGNFGSVDGDTAAAQRYTEAKMTKITAELLRDLDKGTVPFGPNYDSTREEPLLLPALFPNLLCNGCDGIAVGMATKIPPHNLGEVVDALRRMIVIGNKSTDKTIFNELRQAREKIERTPRVFNNKPESYLENYVANDDMEHDLKISQINDRIHADAGERLYPEFQSDITLEELIKIIPGPDFPLGGIIYDRTEILNAYATGRGRILIRAKAQIVEGNNGRFNIIVTEIPYQVNKALMIENMANLVKDKKIEGISDIRDESSREGMRVVISLKKDCQPKVLLNKLYKFTDMQRAFNANMISLVDGEPQLLNLKKMLELFITHRITITIRRYEFDLAQARYHAHILEGLLKALDHLDEVIKTIRESKTQEDAKNNLIEKFDFTEAQTIAILDMQLRRLAALEREKLQEDYDQTTTDIKTYIRILENESEILRVVDEDLAMLKDKYGDARRTRVVVGKADDISEEDTVEDVETFITLSRSGYIKRVPPETYKLQKRGGKGIIGATTKEDDYIQHALTCNNHSDLLLFTNKGRVFTIKAFQVPESSRTSKGIPIVNLIQVESGEIVTSILAKAKDSKVKYLFMATQFGTVKKTEFSDFENIRSSGLISIKLEAGDELKWVLPSTGNDDIVIVTKNGKCIRFHETDVRPTGRNTMGVTGIRFKSTEDCVISVDLIAKEEPGKETKRVLLTISENGSGKKSLITEYDAQHRGGSGVFTYKVKAKTGKLVVAKVLLGDEEEIVIMSTKGQVIRAPLNSIPTLNRQTSGVRVMNLDAGDSVAALAVM